VAAVAARPAAVLFPSQTLHSRLALEQSLHRFVHRIIQSVHKRLFLRAVIKIPIVVILVVVIRRTASIARRRTRRRRVYKASRAFEHFSSGEGARNFPRERLNNHIYIYILPLAFAAFDARARAPLFL
jgi:hypothetical protein